MEKRGGKRPGAGRKKGTASIKAEEARKYLSTRVADELQEIVTGQIEMAKGAYYDVETDEGYRRIYRKLPDSKTAAYLLNQVIGRPTETIDMNVNKPFSLIEIARSAGLIGGTMEEIMRDAPPLQAPRRGRSDLPGLAPATPTVRPNLTASDKAKFKANNPQYKELFEKIDW